MKYNIIACIIILVAVILIITGVYFIMNDTYVFAWGANIVLNIYSIYTGIKISLI